MVKVLQQYLRRVPGVLGLALCTVIGLAAHAQQAPAAAPRRGDSNQLMLQRINELELKVQQLQRHEGPAVPAREPAVEEPRVHSVNDRLRQKKFGEVRHKT